MFATPLFESLNQAQRAVVEHGLGAGSLASPPLLVVAGAGSGKTLTLAARVVRLVGSGADPARILLLTFSRRAAAEMERRVGLALRQAFGLGATTAPPRLPWCGTFHSVGARLLRLHAAQIGLPDDFTVDDRADSQELMQVQRQALGLAAGRQRFPQQATCLAIYSRVANSRRPLNEVLASVFPWCTASDDLQRLFAAYDAAKQAERVLDFDDLLLWWAEAMADPCVGAAIGQRFEHVLVDEYQDTNRVQGEIVLALRPGGLGLTVVGDDAQSIYSFRAAEVRNILDFADAFSPPATVLTLEQNYRSTAPLLAASNAVIERAAERHTKRLWSTRSGGESAQLVWLADEQAQAAWATDRVLALRESGLGLQQQAVLFRSGRHSAALELELTRRNVPFVKYGGLKFLDAAHVRDVLAVLRFASNPRGSRAGARALQLVPGVGPGRAQALLAMLASADDPTATVAAHVGDGASGWQDFQELFALLRAPPQPWPGELEALAAWYQPLLERRHDDASSRAADIAHLLKLATGFVSRERFLTELTLDPPAAAGDEAGPPSRDEDYLILSTIHSAKGQEWAAVTVLNVVDGCMPADMAAGSAAEIDEERRLLYVAMTRARHHLHLLVPQRFYVQQQGAYGDRYVHAVISRFLPPEVQALFEHVRATPPAPSRDLVSSAPPIDIGQRLRARWH